MARLLCYVVAILLFAGESARAETEPDSLAHMPREDTETPRYIFMKQLYDQLADKNADKLSGEKSQSGTLLATGIEATEIQGSGFPIRNGSSERLIFTVPKQKDADNIQSADLWLFPDLDPESVQADRTVVLHLSATAYIPRARTPRRASFKITWSPGLSCLRLDLTALTKKIARNLQKYAGTANETSTSNVTLSLNVHSAVYHTDAPFADSAAYREQAEQCSALRSGISNAPFLIVKYYAESELAERSRDDSSPIGGSKVSSRKKRSDVESSACNVTSLMLNLTDVFPYDYVYPSAVDIGQCTGKCGTAPFYYTMKRTLEWKSGDINIDREAIDCVPVTFRPMELLLISDGFTVIYTIPDFSISECGCRFVNCTD